jgi:hypothetical protein
MRLWRRARNEVAGAWRSLRYDLGRRPASDTAAGATPAGDVTSTGMSTFGGVPAADLRTGYDTHPRSPRRTTAVAAFGALTVVGAAGSYFAVVNGLGAVLGERPAGAQAYPLAAAAPPGETPPVADANSGMGHGSAPRAAGTTAVAVPTRAVALPGTAPAPARTTPRRTEPARPGTPTGEDCDCLTPPVPTPTAPPPPSPTPSAGDPPDPEPSPTTATPSDTPSAGPSGTTGGHQPERHRRTTR